MDVVENLFHGNMAPGLPKPHLQNAIQPGFCLCDGSRQCGRTATSDTTANSSEPRRNVRLGVPEVQRRRSLGQIVSHNVSNGQTWLIFFSRIPQHPTIFFHDVSMLVFVMKEEYQL